MGTSGSQHSVEGTYIGKYKPNLWNPHDILKLDNTFVVTDKSYNRVQVLDENLKHSNTFISTDGIYKSHNIVGKFDPYGIAYTGRSFVVTDLINHCVVEFVHHKPDNVFGQNVLTRPTGIAVDKMRKEIYVADAEQGCIFVFDQEHKDRKFKHKIGEQGKGQGQLNKPWFMAINSKGNLVVAEFGNHRVQMFDPDTRQSVQVLEVKHEGKTWDCRGLALDENDDIYVSVRWGWMRGVSKETVVVYSPAGEFLGNFGSRFDYIRGLTVTRQGNNKIVYVLDGARHSICAYKIKDKRKNGKEMSTAT